MQLLPLSRKLLAVSQRVQTVLLEHWRQPTRKAEQSEHVVVLTMYPVTQVVHTLVLEQVLQLLRVTLQYWQLVPERAYPVLQAHKFPFAIKFPPALQLVHIKLELQVTQPVIIDGHEEQVRPLTA